LLDLDVLQTEKKAAFAIVLFPIQDIPDEGHYLFRKVVGSALTETENWDLLVDSTSRDGRKMLDAGVHLSDKRTLLMKTHRPFQTQYNIFYRIRLCFSKIVVKKQQQIILFLKCFQIYCALSATTRV
jgi:hypothetical protein